jgi:hypothetical protein
MTQFKFKGGERVKVNANEGNLKGMLKVTEFTGTVIVMTSDMPVIGQSYVILADNPQKVGLNTEVFPFSAVTVSELHLTKI